MRGARCSFLHPGQNDRERERERTATFTSNEEGCSLNYSCSFVFCVGEDDMSLIEETRRSSAAARAQVSQLNRVLGLTPSPFSANRNLLYTRPCNFFFTAQGCSKGQDCTFSHDASFARNFAATQPAASTHSTAPLLHSAAASAPTTLRGIGGQRYSSGRGGGVNRGWTGGATSGFKSQGGRGRRMYSPTTQPPPQQTGNYESKDNYLHEQSAASIVDDEVEQGEQEQEMQYDNQQ